MELFHSKAGFAKFKNYYKLYIFMSCLKFSYRIQVPFDKMLGEEREKSKTNRATRFGLQNLGYRNPNLLSSNDNQEFFKPDIIALLPGKKNPFSLCSSHLIHYGTLYGIYEYRCKI